MGKKNYVEEGLRKVGRGEKAHAKKQRRRYLNEGGGSGEENTTEQPHVRNQHTVQGLQ